MNNYKSWIWAMIAMLLVVPIAQFIGKFAGEAQNAGERPRSRDSAPSEVKVLVSRQSADGITESQFDQTFLDNLTSWTVERTEANSRKHLDAANAEANEPKLTGEAVYLERYGHKLAIVRLRLGTITPMATIVGIKGAELVRVLCTTSAPENVAITSGPCDAKLKEVFR